jgi:pyruvate dehydrogenase E2 component (dihydrolipoamide acetyltransferase)
MASATVLRWLVSPGDPFAAGAGLVELEAEEAIVAVQAPEAGTLTKIVATVGQTIPVGSDLAQIETSSRAPAPAATSSKAETIVSDTPADAQSENAVPILMPLAGNTMEEGTVLEWRVSEGDTIELGQILCEIETDKATMEYESPTAGRLARIVAAVDEPIAVKELIAVLADNDADADAFLASQGATAAVAETATPEAVVQTAIVSNGHVATAPAPVDARGRVKASPAARKLAAERGVALETIGTGRGPGGRILSQDIENAPTAKTASVDSAGGRRPMSKMRRAIAANLQRSKQTIPHFYLRVTIDAAPLFAFYREQKPATGCSLNDLVVLAVGRAMRDFPAVRSQIDGNDIVEFPHANIGIAVGVDDGLVVPVVMNVDTLSLIELAKEAKRVVEAGRQGVLENFGKGNFTISNLGMFGVEEFSAIINPPESGILAVSAMRETVIVKDGSMSPGRVMTMTLSADHRVVDGLLGAQFMARLKEILEHPEKELS